MQTLESPRERLAGQAKDLQRRIETIEVEPKKFSYALLGVATAGFIALAGVLVTINLHPTDSCGIVAALFLLVSIAVGCFGVWVRREHDHFRVFTDFLPVGIEIEALDNPKIDHEGARAFVKDAEKKFDECNLEAAYDLQGIFRVQAWSLGISLAFVVAWIAIRVFTG